MLLFIEAGVDMEAIHMFPGPIFYMHNRSKMCMAGNMKHFTPECCKVGNISLPSVVKLETFHSPSVVKLETSHS